MDDYKFVGVHGWL